MEQESQKRKLVEENAAVLCVNNCGFFGNAKTNNLCSKCYKEFLLKQPLNHTSLAEQPQIPSLLQEAKDKDDDVVVVVEEKDGGATSEVKPAVTNRCSFCKKRVGLTGFKCRCGHTFCSQHRYSDRHNCVFNYKSAGQDAIAKANPVVKADKIDKI